MRSCYGAEVLEEREFEPFFTDLESKLSGKNVALFGGYGEWIRDWEKRVTDAGKNLIGGEGLIVNDAPNDEGLDQCREFGKTAASA